MGNICSNGDFCIAIITCDLIILKETDKFLLTIPIKCI